MKKILLVKMAIFISCIAFSQTYQFTGNGLWTISANWHNNAIPPAVLPPGDTIIISPATGDSCVLNVAQTISAGANLIIAPNANFIVMQGVTILGLTPSGDSTFIDTRDGQIYSFKHIGTQVWMTKNLNYAGGRWGSWCYSNSGSNCDVYGRLYTAYDAPAMAPPGWHLPSNEEWQTLINYLGGSQVAGGKMKEEGTTHWAFSTGADNSSGFSGLPGGFYDGNLGTYDMLGYYGFWWSSTSLSGSENYLCYLDYGSAAATMNYHFRGLGHSIRCVRDTISPPFMVTDIPAGITDTSVIFKGEITRNGGSVVTVSGFVWDTLPAPSITLLTKTVSSVITDTFSANITGLQPGTTYYVRAYATNSAGTGYGNERSFVTMTPPPPLPTVYTDTVGNITTFTATSGGIVSGSSVTASGLVWNTLPSPTISLSTKTINTILTDTFSNTITGLQPGTTYYVRAYATNSAGTGYGNERSFRTRTVDTNPNGDSIFTDPRDGQVYTFRHLGTQVWMTRNLNHATDSGSWAYNNDTANYALYGRLYNWNAAVTAAPPGWHLPSDSEWLTLTNYIGSAAGNAMRDTITGLWPNSDTLATNSSGFSALPGGYRLGTTGVFYNKGTGSFWWTATEASPALVWYRGIRIGSDVERDTTSKNDAISIRCIRDY